jgi:hypothetical protein
VYALFLTGLAGLGAVVAIGSAVVAVGTRRTRPAQREEVDTAARP